MKTVKRLSAVLLPVVALVGLLAWLGARIAQADGDVVTVCLSGSCDYTSVREAVVAVNEGGVVKVAGGDLYRGFCLTAAGGIPGAGFDLATGMDLEEFNDQGGIRGNILGAS